MGTPEGPGGGAERGPGRIDFLGLASIGLAVGLVGALALTIHWSRESDADRVRQELAREARRVAADIAMHLAGEREMVGGLALQGAEGPLDGAVFRAAALQLMSEQPQIMRVAWMAPDGRLLVQVGDAAFTPPAQVLSVLADALREGQAYSPPLDYPGGPGFAFAAATPRGAKVRGVVLATYSAARLLEHVHPESDEGGHSAALLGPTGALLAGRAAGAKQTSAAPVVPPGNGLFVLVSNRPTSRLGSLAALATLSAVLGLALALNLRSLRRQLARRGAAEAAARRSEARERHRRAALELLARGAGLREVLDGVATALEEAHPGAVGLVLELDSTGRTVGVVAAPSLPQSFRRALEGQAAGAGAGPAGSAALTGRSEIAVELGREPGWAGHAALAALAGLRSCCAEPVLSATGQSLGAVALYRRDGGGPRAEEAEAVAGAARLAAIAIERARGDEALRESEANLSALVACLEESNRALAAVSRAQTRFIDGQPPPHVFQELLEALLAATGSQQGLVAEVVAEPACPPALRCVASVPSGLDAGAGTSDPGGCETLLGAALSAGTTVLANDAQQAGRPTGLPAALGATTSFLGVPVCHGLEVLGLIALANRPGGYDQAQLPLLEPFLSTAATLLSSLRSARQRDTAELRRRQSEERYRGLVEGVEALVWEADPRNQRTLFVSSRAEEILGYPVSRWLDEPTFWQDHLHPEDRARVVAHYARAQPGRRQIDYRMIAADGRVVWLHELSRTDADEHGRALRLSGVSIDVTRAHELEQAVTLAAAEWTTTFDAVGFAVFVLDERRLVTRLNRAASALAGASWHDCLGHSLERLGDDEPWRTCALVAGGVGAEGRTDLRQVRDAAGRSWKVEATVASSRTGGPDRVIVTLREVTDVVELVESVRRAETMAATGALVAGVAHEVRNPLFGMSVNIDALALELRDHPDLQELVDALRAERDRLSRLMEELLHYGRPSTPRLAPGPLAPVLERALAACRPLANSQGVRLERVGHADGLTGRLDPDRLQEVFQNLLENACQHSRPGQTVLLEVDGTAGATGGRLRVHVRDFGPGFPPDVLSRAFQPFVTRRKGGSGLGLAIVQRIVDEHGGRVHAANAPEGGAVVSVELPLVGREPSQGS